MMARGRAFGVLHLAGRGHGIETDEREEDRACGRADAGETLAARSWRMASKAGTDDSAKRTDAQLDEHRDRADPADSGCAPDQQDHAEEHEHHRRGRLIQAAGGFPVGAGDREMDSACAAANRSSPRAVR